MRQKRHLLHIIIMLNTMEILLSQKRFYMEGCGTKLHQLNSGRFLVVVD